ncbi:MAG: NADH dehydrogenase FAD-containing subunit [Myxococcota bacterium]|jgi:NADH dehydrogenase FAD-containing subunit
MSSARVIIIGGGFAGLEAARQLRGSRHTVTVVDPEPRFSWQPNLHELLSGRKTAAALSLPRRTLVERWGHTFSQHRALHIDTDRQAVALNNRSELRYDVLLVATGGRAAVADLPALRQHSVGLRRVEQGEQLARRLSSLQAAGSHHDVVVMGGGFIGVEILGELLRSPVPGRQLTLVEGGERLMAGFPESIHRSVMQRLADAGVSVRLGARVAEARPGAVVLQSGERLPSDLTIEALGLGPPPLLAASGLAGGQGWAPVRRSLQSTHHDNVFILGDSARLSGGLSKQAYHALKMGAAASGGVERVLRGRSPRPFRPMEEVFLVTFGAQTTFFVARGLAVEQRALAAMRELIFQQGMLALDPPTVAAARARLGDRVHAGLLRRLWPQAA